jgi:hypothetical protein
MRWRFWMLGRGVLGEEIEKLEAFERNKSDVGISMVAWVAVAKK